MNESFKEMKERIRRLHTILERRGASEDVAFAQALSFLDRAERRGNRSREPTPELLSLLERAELFGHRLE